jgi:hypothetical protein
LVFSVNHRLKADERQASVGPGRTVSMTINRLVTVVDQPMRPDARTM